MDRSNSKLVRVSAIVLGCFLTLVITSKVWAAPAPPDYVFAKGTSSMDIIINWESVAGVEGYNVYRSVAESGPYEKIGQVMGDTNTYFIDKDADYSTSQINPMGASWEYYYKVSAYDSGGESSLSNVISHSYTDENGQIVQKVLSKGKTKIAEPPSGVILTDNHDGTIKISWIESQESNIVGYNVYRSEVSGGTEVKLNNSLITSLEYIDTVNFYGDYYYTVAAVDATGQQGNRSAEKWIKPEALPPVDVPHVGFQKNAKECAYCHNTHASPGADLVNKKTESELCFVCHDGTGSKNITYQEFSGNYPSKHPLAQNGLSCASCHDAHLDYKSVDPIGNRTYPALLQPISENGNMVYKGNEQCYKCHGPGSLLKGGDHKTAFENSVHNTSMPNPLSGTEIKCAVCHEPHAGPNKNLKAYKDENSCFACHNPDAAGSTPDIFTSFHSGGSSETRHDVLEKDKQQTNVALQCVNCHNPHGATVSNKLVDPDNPRPDSQWAGTQNDFCLKCHDGTFPADSQTIPHAEGVSAGNKILINIEDNSSKVHVSKLECSACHDPHGTINDYSLKTETVSYFTGTNKKGLLTYSWYYQDNNGQTLRGVDFRFFCNSCHGPNNHIDQKTFPTDCSKCHKHDSKF